MAIEFSNDRWEQVKDTYGKWWEGNLSRPIIPVVLTGADPGRKKPDAPLLSQQTSLDLSFSANDLIDRIDYELSGNVYLGDSFPYFNMDCFGPGVLAAFLGARPDNSTGTIWFHCDEIKELKDLHFEYDPDNIWLRRVKDLYQAADNRWRGQVVMGMVDLGGVLDILATFRTTEHLLTDLYDEPDEVKRLINELHHVWLQYFDELNSVISRQTPGYSDWSRIYSEKPCYVIQSDFSYMLGPDMFREFVKDDLEGMAKKIPNTLYHLDGAGQLCHLDELLKIKEINAVQWVPGAGALPQDQWPDVYKKISLAGKGIQLWDGFDCIDQVSKDIGTMQGILHITMVDDMRKREYYESKLSLYGVGSQ